MDDTIDEGPRPCEKCGRADDSRWGDYVATDRGVEVWYNRLCAECDDEVSDLERTDAAAAARR